MTRRRLTQRRAVSSCGQRACVAVRQDAHRVSGDTGQDVLGAIVTNLLVVVDITLQHFLNPGNHTVRRRGGFSLKVLKLRTDDLNDTSNRES